jgi:hypothetical protein
MEITEPSLFLIPAEDRKRINRRLVDLLKAAGFEDFIMDKEKIDRLQCVKNKQRYMVRVTAWEKRSSFGHPPQDYLDYRFQMKKYFDALLNFVEFEQHRLYAFAVRLSRDAAEVQVLQTRLSPEDRDVKRIVNQVRNELYCEQFVDIGKALAAAGLK